LSGSEIDKLIPAAGAHELPAGGPVPSVIQHDFIKEGLGARGFTFVLTFVDE
jgi:hypothetical protein